MCWPDIFPYLKSLFLISLGIVSPNSSAATSVQIVIFKCHNRSCLTVTDLNNDAKHKRDITSLLNHVINLEKLTFTSPAMTLGKGKHLPPDRFSKTPVDIHLIEEEIKIYPNRKSISDESFQEMISTSKLRGIIGDLMRLYDLSFYSG